MVAAFPDMCATENSGESAPHAGLAGRLCFRWGWVESLLLLMICGIPCAQLWLPIEYAYENSPIENAQMLVLLACFIACLQAKTDKKFYICVALLCTILMLREVNCGRTVFFPKEGAVNEFYSWKELEYGYLAHPLYGLYMGATALYFLLSRSYKVLWGYVLHAKIAVWLWLCIIGCSVLVVLCEKLGASMMEEAGESVVYVAFLALICFHAFHKENNGPCQGEA